MPVPILFSHSRHTIGFRSPKFLDFEGWAAHLPGLEALCTSASHTGTTVLRTRLDVAYTGSRVSRMQREKSEWLSITAAPPSSGALQNRLPPYHLATLAKMDGGADNISCTASAHRCQTKSVEKPGSGVILVAVNFFHMHTCKLTWGTLNAGPLLCYGGLG